jgi:hypothetical protein
MGRAEIAGFRRKSYKTLQAMARKTATFQSELNGMAVVQGELCRSGRRYRQSYRLNFQQIPLNSFVV